MEQSTFLYQDESETPAPVTACVRKIHVAIIMDGNGRWATARGLSRSHGHRAGADTARRIIRCAPRFGIRTLTLYAFSADNWRRPPHEVRFLMYMLRTFLDREIQTCLDNGVRVQIIGRRDRIPRLARAAVERIESATADGRTLQLRLAVDYSSRHVIVAAARRLGDPDLCSHDVFSQLIGEACHSPGVAPDVDLLIRTGGEQRLSDFLLWESAYAELVFTQRMWPEFSQADLHSAITEFASRQRRFGALGQQQPEISHA